MNTETNKPVKKNNAELTELLKQQDRKNMQGWIAKYYFGVNLSKERFFSLSRQCFYVSYGKLYAYIFDRYVDNKVVSCVPDKVRENYDLFQSFKGGFQAGAHEFSTNLIKEIAIYRWNYFENHNETKYHVKMLI